jgi:phosphonate transport system substrate-binding protein
MTRKRAHRRTVAAGIALLTVLAHQPASADWRKDLGTFRIGVVAEPGAGNAISGLTVLTQAYSAALGMPVRFFVARDYPALIEAQVEGRVDYAVYSATAYAIAAVRCGCVEPLVAPTDADGAVGIRSVLVTRDSRVGSPADMAQRRVALGPPDSVAASLVPLADLAAAGVEDVSSQPFLRRAASAEDAERMLQAGTVDAVFGWERAHRSPRIPPQPPGGTVARLVSAGIPASALQVIWRSEVLRYGPHAVRSDLDAQAKRRLVAFLIDLKARAPEVYGLIERNHACGFVAVGGADYAAALALVKATGQATEAGPSSSSR